MKSFQRNSILIAALFLAAFIMIRSTEHFRANSELRWIYHIGWISCYIFHLSSLILAILSLISILKNDTDLNIKYRWFWIALSLTPFLYYTACSIF